MDGQKLEKYFKTAISDKFLTNSSFLTGTPKNNCWDKCWANLGCGVFLNVGLTFFVPICSNFFRFVFRTNQGTPFFRPDLHVPSLEVFL